jgi:hypothetical protein
MTPQPDHRHYVRRVVLPSGKTIEVVYFEDQMPPEPAAGSIGQVDEVAADLHICGSCGSDLVYPTEWEESGTRHWEVVLRCPNCEWIGTGVFEQEIVDRFDEELDRATQILLRDLKRLMHSNMEEQIERFSDALGRDVILPEDF